MIKALAAALALTLGVLPMAQAAVLMDVTKYCKNISSKKNSAQTSALRLVNVENGVAQLLIVGFPSSYSITFNGIDLRPYKIRESSFKCYNKNAGSFLFYNLNQLRADAGTLLVQADSLTLKQNITLSD